MLHSKEVFNQWQPALFDGQFHWDFLLPAWMGTRIEPADVDAQFTVDEEGNTSVEAMDIDAKIERKGHRLIFETKNKSPMTLNLGARILLKNEWRLGATIVFLDGKTPEEINNYGVLREDDYSKNTDIEEEPKMMQGDAFDVIYFCRCWFLWAQNKKRPTRKEWDTQLWKWDYDRSATWDKWCRDQLSKK